MKPRTWVALAAVALVLVITGFLWVADRINGFDERYADCMRHREPALNAQGHYWPDDAFQQAIAQCQSQAGPPTPSHDNASWRWP